MNLKASLKRYSFLDPIVITLSLWLFVIVGNFVFGIYPLEFGFLGVLVTAIGVFVLGMFAYRLWIQILLTGPSNEVSLNNPIVAFKLTSTKASSDSRLSRVLILVQLFLFIFFLKAYSAEADFSDPLAFVKLRNIYIEEVKGERGRLFIYTTHATLLGLSLTYVLCKRYFECIDPKKKKAFKRLFFTASLLSLLTSVLTTSRTTPLLVLIFFIFFCYRFYIYKRSTILKVFFGFFLVIFFSIALILGKGGLNVEAGASGNLQGITDLIKIYFFSAPKAMEYIYYNPVGYSDDFCSNIFKYFVGFISKVFNTCNCIQHENDFVFIPEPTNVFTFFRAYWQDFGWFFPLAIFPVGVLIDFVYQRAITSFSVFTFIYPFFINSLLLQIFEEQIFSNMSVLVYLLFFYFLLQFMYNSKYYLNKIFGWLR